MLGADAYDNLIQQMMARGGTEPNALEQAQGRAALMGQALGGRRGKQNPGGMYHLGSGQGGLHWLAEGGPISRLYYHKLKGAPHPSLMAKNPMMPHTWDDYLEDPNYSYMRGGAG